MKLLRMFGIGTAAAIAGSETKGIVYKVSTCYWLKINTKSVRTNASDGAVYPHIIHFTYTADDKEYHGKRYVQWNKRCPYKDEIITVYYESEKPDNYAVIV